MDEYTERLVSAYHGTHTTERRNLIEHWIVCHNMPVDDMNRWRDTFDHNYMITAKRMSNETGIHLCPYALEYLPDRHLTIRSDFIA